jgi:hypothetical protein
MIRLFTLYDNKVTTDITPYCNSVQISGDVQQCARKLDVTITYPIFDKNHSRTQVGPGTLVWVLDDDGNKIFEGMVFNRELSSSQQVTFTAYDFLIYLLKSKASYNFQNINPQQIINTICSEVGVTKGSIPEINISISRLFQSQSLYDIIMTVYTQISKQTGKKYIPMMRNKSLDIIEKGTVIPDFFIEINKNLLSTSYSDTLDNMINKIKIYDDKGKFIDKVEIDTWQKKFGIFQETYTKEDDKNPYAVARNMLHGVDNQVSIEILGDLRCRTGYGVALKVPYVDVLNNRTWFIDADCHSWDMNSGKYTTQLTLHDENTMDRKGEEE